MSTSKLQKETSRLLSIYFGDCTIRENVHPEWLKQYNPHWELDFLIEEMNIAIEVQGEQHYKYIEFFHGNPENFQQLKQRDQIKREICAEHGIVLHEVAGECDLIPLIEQIIARKYPSLVTFEYRAPKTTVNPLVAKKWILALKTSIETHDELKIGQCYASVREIIHQHYDQFDTEVIHYCTDLMLEALSMIQEIRKNKRNPPMEKV